MVVQKRFDNSLKKKIAVRVKFRHLNPILQEIIGRSSSINKVSQFYQNDNPIMSNRSVRAFTEILTTINLLKMFQFTTFTTIHTIGVSAGATMRTIIAREIQKKHVELLSEMKKVGLLQVEHESNYPKDWMNPTIVSSTHPVCYVAANGDLVFRRITRLEYARSSFQNRWPGKWGLNLWRWRIFLKPPKAPKTVMEWAMDKAREWLPRKKEVYGMVSKISTRRKKRKPNKIR